MVHPPIYLITLNPNIYDLHDLRRLCIDVCKGSLAHPSQYDKLQLYVPIRLALLFGNYEVLVCGNVVKCIC